MFFAFADILGRIGVVRMKKVKRILSVLLIVALTATFVGAFSIGSSAVTPLGCVIQKDPKWKSYYYGGGNLYDTGCGIFSLVNAVGYLTGRRMSVTEVAAWAHEIGAYNAGTSAGGTTRGYLYPKVQAQYGSRYGFTVDCGGSGGTGYWNITSYNTTLQNHLANGGVAIGHVPGHFIALVNFSGGKYHVYESYPSSTRGTQNATNGSIWLTPAQLNSGYSGMKLDWFCLLSSTGGGTESGGESGGSSGNPSTNPGGGGNTVSTATQPFRTFYYNLNGTTDTADSSLNNFNSYGMSYPGGFINSPSYVGAYSTLASNWSAVAGELTKDCTLTSRGTEYKTSLPIRLFLDGRTLTAVSGGYAFNQEKANTTTITGNTFAVSSEEGTETFGTINGNGNCDTVAQSAGTLNFRNLTLNSSSSSGNNNAFYQTAGDATFRGVTVRASGSDYGAAVGVKGKLSSVANSSFISTRTSSSGTDASSGIHLRGGSIGTWTNSNITTSYGEALWVDGGSVSIINGGNFTGGTNGNGIYISNNGTVGTVMNGVFASTGANAGINITSGSTLNTISGGTIKGITISGTLGTITGGTFDFSTYTASNYGTIKNYIASGKVARLDSTSGSGIFTVVNNSGLTSGTYMAAPNGVDYTTGTATINGVSYTTYTVSTQTVPVESVSLDKNTLSLSVGGTGTLVVTVNPSNATDKTITWTTSNGGVATVYNGVVTANGVGTAVLTATAGGKSASCTVTVTQATTATVTIDKGYAAVNKGGTVTLTATCSGGAVSWASSNTSVATVSNGVVTGVAKGEATITASCGSVSVSATVRVTDYTSPAWGVDVSHHQGTIDWAKLKQSGVDFAIIRLGLGVTDSTGTLTYDRQWAANIAGARAAGIDIGVYLYAYATTTSAALREAQLVVEELNKYPGYFTYPVWYDFENDNAKSTSRKSANAEVIKTFCDYVGNAGYYTGIYTYTSFFTSYIDDSQLTSYDHWVAQYGANDGEPHSVSYTGSYGMWQYTSLGLGKVVSGSVQSSGLDLNYAYKNYPSIIINNGLNKFDTSSKSATGGVPTVPVTGVSLNTTSASMLVGENLTLIATVNPSNATDKTVVWSTSNGSVATVYGGVMTANGAGTATITATAGGKSASCAVTVTATVPATGITLNRTSATMNVGENLALTATVTPSNAADKTVTWTSTVPTVATVENGVVRSLAAGTTTIKATNASGHVAECTITVTSSYVSTSRVTLSSSTLALRVGETFGLDAKIAPLNATNKTVAWSSNNVNVASIASEGTVTAVGVGTATVTATTADGKTDICTVTVTLSGASSSDLSLNAALLQLKENETYTLRATVNAVTVSGGDVEWTSSDTSVVTVVNGTVTAVGVGSATVTATANGKSASCAVFVASVYTTVENITLDRVSLLLTPETVFALTATVTPSDATNTAIIWETSDPTVATVENGVVVAMYEGTAEISAISPDGARAVCTVTVSDPRTVVESGSCGDSASYVLYGDGELLIRGFGDIDSVSAGAAPWYANRSEIKKVTILSGVTSVGYYAFSDCTNLETVLLPESVETIGRYAFAGCTKLSEISLPNAITEIASHAFFGCSSLTEIVIPTGVTRISPSAFEDCISLVTVVLHDGVTTIGESSFEGCSSLTSINIPSAAVVKNYAFDGCPGLNLGN